MDTNDKDRLTRRVVVNGMAVGVVGALAPGALAQQTPESTPQTVRRDPLSEYPRPPFQEQHQPWPGLACRAR